MKRILAKTWTEILKEARGSSSEKKEGASKRRINLGGVPGFYADLRCFNPDQPEPHGITFYLQWFNSYQVTTEPTTINSDSENSKSARKAKKDSPQVEESPVANTKTKYKSRTYTFKPGMKYTKAKQEAMRLWSMISQGKDPLAKKESAKRGVETRKSNTATKVVLTFKKLAEAYIEAMAKGGKWAQWQDPNLGERKERQHAERHVYPVIGELPAIQVTPLDVANLLNPLIKKAPKTAHKTKTFIRKVYRWAMASGQYGIENSPIDERLEVLTEQARKLMPEHGNMGSVPPHQIRDFIRDLLSGTAAPSNSRLAIVFAILTAARSQAVRLAKWVHVNFETGEWTIPRENDKLKGARRHRTIYLSKQALDLLSRLPRISEYIFPSRNFRPLTANSFPVTIKKLHLAKKKQDGIGWCDPAILNKDGEPILVSQHGCRATFKTWAVDDKNGNNKKFPEVASELCLLHEPNDPFKHAYNRNDYAKTCRELMQAWGDFCFRDINLDDYVQQLVELQD